ncbi:hypothetical protein AB0N05_30185 [Nocardia sp. NPDC051030]|uniref:hypothetical protein n=1 Tax=Nocardia sp. NPDC051030 TaxID=3155162 RepID=UPI0034185783
MPSYIDLLLHPAAAVDFVHHLAAQLIGGWSNGSSTPDVGLGSSIPGSGSGTGSGIGQCTPTGSVSLSGGMDCGTSAGSATPN